MSSLKDAENRIKSTNKIVVKVGTSTITHASGKLDLRIIESLVRVLSDLKNQGKDIILVTSGAIGVGVAKMGLSKKPDLIPQKQALAAIGQVNLMNIYSRLFGDYGYQTSQILLTKDVLDGGERELNARNTIETLFEYNTVPIVNENDTISIEQIKFGDNDTLSARVAVLLKADLLIILSDIDGLYDKDPQLFENAKLIPLVREFTEDILNSCGDAHNDMGTGGMKTKILAAQICNAANIPMFIINGNKPSNIYSILQGETIGTLFKPRKNCECRS